MKRLVNAGATRKPMLRVLVAGAVLAGVKSASVEENSHYQSDNWRATFALNAPDGRDLPWWGADERRGETYDVQAKLDADWTSLIVGDADRISVHPATGLVEASGRDLTARLIEAKTQETFQNQTASQIATILAGRHGLTPVVTATTELVSRYYAADHDRITSAQFSRVGTEWDLLTYLAQREGFDVFVVGTELHFQPATDPTKAEPYGVSWNQDQRLSEVADLRLERSLTLAKDVVVTVRSWRSREGRGFERSSPRASPAAVRSGKVQRRVFVRPNLTEDQAQKEADRLRAEITKYERNIEFRCPGELALTPRDIIALTGCGAGWDQTFYVNTISRQISFEGGFAQTVTAKNHSPESDATVG